ncbi:MAG: hypothetical protein WA705_27210 [Candidatus Ozemobacteraceae bacterium]
MAGEVTLEQIKTALFQPNSALKKRALAVIHNRGLVEACGLLQQFVGVEQDIDLQTFALRILEKLKTQEAKPSEITSLPVEKELVPLLMSPEPGKREQALRLMLGHRSSIISSLLQERCQNELHPDVAALVAENLRNNPDVANFPLIRRLLESPSTRVRVEAYRALQSLINGCFLPILMNGMTDESQEIEMTLRQMVNLTHRRNLLDAYGFMLSSGVPERSRQAVAMMASCMGPDLLPMIRTHIRHSDGPTLDALRVLLEQLVARGTPEAANILSALKSAQGASKDGEEASDVGNRASGPAEVFRTLAADLREFWKSAPAWLLEPLLEPGEEVGPAEVIGRIRKVFDRVRYLLTVSYICVYFQAGNRSAAADRAGFRAIQQEITGVNTVHVLRFLGDALPEPAGTGDFFPQFLAFRLHRDEEDTFFESFTALHEGFTLLDEYPDAAEGFLQPAVDGMTQLFKSLEAFLETNRLIAKINTSEGLKIYDYWGPSPTQVDARTVTNFFLPLQCPVLISRDSMQSLSLAPFMSLDPARGALSQGCPDEHALWEFFKKLGVHEAYLAFLSDTRE